MNDLQTFAPPAIINIDDFAMSIESLKKQVQIIKKLMDEVMIEDVHYGIIPGTKKKTLYKPGADKLCFLFRLEPLYEIIREEREKEFIAYTVQCTLMHSPTGKEIATGLGSCNSRETKYYWRYEVEPTDKPVPSEYWKAKQQNNNKEMKRIMGDGRPYKTEDGKWVIATSKKVINDNPWDIDNTLIKMACKRSYLGATLHGTAASDVFDQPLDDDDPEGLGKKPPPETNEVHPDEFDHYINANYKDIDKDLMHKFVKACADQDKKTVENIKARAMKSIDAFMGAFEKWEEKQPKKEKPKRTRKPKENKPTEQAEPAKQEPPKDRDPVYTNLHYCLNNFKGVFKAKADELGFPDEIIIDELPLDMAHMLHNAINKEVDKY